MRTESPNPVTPVVGSLPVSATNPFPVSAAIDQVSAGTVTSVDSSASSGTLLAANTARKGVLIVNTDVNALLVKFGATASASSFTVRIPGNFGQWQMEAPIYTGIIDGIWEADGSGAAIVTEV
jgi:hypothetical protein